MVENDLISEKDDDSTAMKALKEKLKDKFQMIKLILD